MPAGGKKKSVEANVANLTFKADIFNRHDVPIRERIQPSGRR